MDKDKTIKKGVIAGIIASIIFMVILEPLMKLIWSFLINTSSSIYTSYFNSIFKNAALGHRNHVDFMTYAILTIIFIGVMTFFYLKTYFYMKTSRYDNSITQDKTKEQIENEVAKIASKITKLNNRMKIIFVVGAVCCFIFSCISFSNLFKEYSNLQLNTSFNQKINAISPYINDNEQKVIISKWALMNSKNDYLEIKRNIDNIAKMNHFQLPEELIKY